MPLYPYLPFGNVRRAERSHAQCPQPPRAFRAHCAPPGVWHAGCVPQVSSESNPNVPEGGLFPACELAPNATAAADLQALARRAVPFLIAPGLPHEAEAPWWASDSGRDVGLREFDERA